MLRQWVGVAHRSVRHTKKPSRGAIVLSTADSTNYEDFELARGRKNSTPQCRSNSPQAGLTLAQAALENFVPVRQLRCKRVSIGLTSGFSRLAGSVLIRFQNVRFRT